MRKRRKRKMTEKEVGHISWRDLIPVGNGAIIIDRGNLGTLYVDNDAEGSVEIRLEPRQKGYKSVTFSLVAKHGKISIENCKGGKVHQEGCSFKVVHERK